MGIDWVSFSPGSALAGGALIGCAATLLALANGRVAGISGILGGLLGPWPADAAWRLAFLAATPAFTAAGFATVYVLTASAGGLTQ